MHTLYVGFQLLSPLSYGLLFHLNKWARLLDVAASCIMDPLIRTKLDPRSSKVGNVSSISCQFILFHRIGCHILRFTEIRYCHSQWFNFIVFVCSWVTKTLERSQSKCRMQLPKIWKKRAPNMLRRRSKQKVTTYK